MICFKYKLFIKNSMIIELEDETDGEIEIKSEPNETTSEISEVDILEITSDTTE